MPCSLVFIDFIFMFALILWLETFKQRKNKHKANLFQHLPDGQDVDVLHRAWQSVYCPKSPKRQLVRPFSFLCNLERHNHNEDTAGTLFSRSCEIPFKADLCFKLFLFCVFSSNFVVSFFSGVLLFLVVLCSLSSCSFEAITVLSAFSTYRKGKINFQFTQKRKWQIFKFRSLLYL